MKSKEFEVPFRRFGEWMALAEEKEPGLANAVSMATVDEQGRPSLRMVLLKGWDETGFVFYTNLGSRKSRDLEGNHRVALLLYWKSLNRQIRIEGPVSLVDDQEADDYFKSRPREARIGAWASRQSEVLDGWFKLEKAVAKYAAKFGIGEIPRPDFWSGYRLKPEAIEFWSQGKFRLHKRELFTATPDNRWRVETLYP